MILPEPFVIICFPKRCKFFPGKEILHVDPDFLRQAVHARHKHIQMEENIIGFPIPQTRIRILEC